MACSLLYTAVILAAENTRYEGSAGVHRARHSVQFQQLQVVVYAPLCVGLGWAISQTDRVDKQDQTPDLISAQKTRCSDFPGLIDLSVNNRGAENPLLAEIGLAVVAPDRIPSTESVCHPPVRLFNHHDFITRKITAQVTCTLVPVIVYARH